MPSQIAHYIFALDLVSSSSLSGKVDLGFLFLGAQGPDIFYHNQRTKPSAVSYGGLIHRRDWGRMSLELAQRLPLEEPWAQSYLLGWISHGVLDRAWHPYIIYRAGWKDPSDPATAHRRFFHPYLERVLDVAFFEYKYSKKLREAPFQPQLPTSDTVIQRLLGPMAEALDRVYSKDRDQNVLMQRVSNAFSDSLGFFQFFDPWSFTPGERTRVSDRSLSLVHPYTLDQQDYLNLGINDWVDPGTLETRSHTIPQLYQEALVQTVELMEKTDFPLGWQHNGALLEPLLKNTSLNLVDEDGQRVGPKICQPFDLGKLLERQKEDLTRLF